mmetsp:Transcript_9454/g.18203  ORF Transcript_9454/g.18203 Transcript_9454/m.18203 type:complete len:134 (+) Transcript_9454:2153-2554(+)
MSRKGKYHFSENRNLIALIGDEDTVTGFLLTGIGERNHRGETNFLIVDNSTTHAAIQAAFTRFIERQDIAIVLITQSIAERELRDSILAHQAAPIILEIPSKDCPYEPEKDLLLQMAARKLFGADKGARALND